MLIVYTGGYFYEVEEWFRRLFGRYMYYGADWYCGDGSIKDAASMYWWLM